MITAGTRAGDPDFFPGLVTLYSGGILPSSLTPLNNPRTSMRYPQKTAKTQSIIPLSFVARFPGKSAGNSTRKMFMEPLIKNPLRTFFGKTHQPYPINTDGD
jgi:hypothetical protein